MPKAKSKTSKNTQNKKQNTSKDHVPRVFEIYNQLLTDSITDLPSKLVDLLSESQENFKLSMLTFILKLVGLSNFAKDVTLVDIKTQIASILEEIQKDPKSVSTIHFANSDTDEHRVFSSNFSQFLSEGLFTNSNRIITQIPILQWLVDWLSILSNSKLRVVRSVAVEVLNRMVLKCIKFYDQKDSIANRALKKFMEGVTEVMIQRIKDVEKKIRITSCNTILSIYTCLQNQILTIQELKNTFGGMIQDKREQINILGLLYTKKLYSIQDSPLLIKFANLILQKVFHLCSKYKELAPTGIDLLITLKRYSPSIQIQLPSVINLMCLLVKTDDKYLLKLASQLFYITAFSFYAQNQDKRKARVSLDLKEILSCIVNSFSSDPEDFKQKIKIFVKLIEFDYVIYDANTMFQLLDREELFDSQENTFNRMTKNQLHSYLIFMYSYTLVLRESIQIEYTQRNKMLESYSSKLFKSYKRIIFQQIPQNSSMTEDFIRLFINLSPKTDQNSKDIEIIFNQLYKIFKSNDNSKLHQSLLQVIQLLYPQGLKTILNGFNMERFENFNEDQLNRICALSSTIDFTENLRINQLSELMPKFFSKKSQKIQSYILHILHHAHSFRLRALLKEIDETSLDCYIDFRNSFTFFLTDILKKDTLTSSIKELAFKSLCETLNIILYPKISQVQIFYFDISDQLINSMFLFLHQSILNKDPDYSLEEIFQKLQLIDESQIPPNKVDLLRQITHLSTQIVRFGTMTLPVKLLATLLKSKRFKIMVKDELVTLARSEMTEQNSTRFTFWKMFKAMFLTSHLKDNDKKLLYIQVLSIYFTLPQYRGHSKQFTRKFILFCGEAIDETFKNKRWKDFKILSIIIDRYSRRFSKQTISNLLSFIQRKIATVEQSQDSEQCKQFRKIMRKLAGLDKNKKTKVSKRTSNKEQKQIQSSDQSQKQSSSRQKSVSSQSSKSSISKSSSQSIEQSQESSRDTSPNISLRNLKSNKNQKSLSKQKTKDREKYVGREYKKRNLSRK